MTGEAWQTLALVLGFVAQAATVAYWGGRLAGLLSSLGQRVDRIERTLDEHHRPPWAATARAVATPPM